jgi:monofunctional biosynthetic peptidoglycan transglycosylase
VSWKRRLRKIIVWLLFAVTAVVLAVLVAISVLVLSSPGVTFLREGPPPVTSYMRLRGDTNIDVRVTYAELASISPYLVCGVIKSEDRNFFGHRGIEWRATRRAIDHYLAGRARYGASTITQQLARNLFFGSERTVLRKVREWLVAADLEAHLSKPEILELYLNVIEWGPKIWGVRAASRHYFGKEPRELSIFEATFLAGLLPSPRRELRAGNLERIRRLQSRILGQLLHAELITQEQHREATSISWRVGKHLERGQPLSLLESPGVASAHPRPIDWTSRDPCQLELEITSHSRERGLPRPKP